MAILFNSCLATKITFLRFPWLDMGWRQVRKTLTNKVTRQKRTGECEWSVCLRSLPVHVVKTDFSITIGVIVSSRLCRFQLRWWHSVGASKVRQSSLMQAFYTILKSQTLRWAVTNKAGVHSTTRCLSTGTKMGCLRFSLLFNADWASLDLLLVCNQLLFICHVDCTFYSVVNISCTFDHVHCAQSG